MTQMTKFEIKSGDFTFSHVRGHQWQVTWNDQHFAYVSYDAVRRALAAA
jgi:hypothetical protein